MEDNWLNETWSNGSQTPVQNVTSSINDILPTNQSKQVSIDWASEKKALYIAEIFLHCTFLIIGLTGNTLTIAVLLYKKWTNVTSRHILMALAVSDTIMIITHTFNQDFLKDLLKLDTRSFSDFGCKAFFLIHHTSKMTSSWFLVFLCFERFIAVTFPLKVKQIVTERRTKIYILFNYLIMTGFTIIPTFSTTVQNGDCKKNLSKEKSAFRALMLFEMLLYSIVPIVLMSIFTPIIILKLFKRNQAKKRISNNDREKQQLQDLIRTTVILISVVIAFVICVTPTTVFQQLKFWQTINKKEMETVFSIFLFREISQRFEQINFSINFFLYIFTSPTFRKSVLEMLHIKRKTDTQKIKESKKTKQYKTQASPEGPKCTEEPNSKKTTVDQLEPSYSTETPCTTESDLSIWTVSVKTDNHYREEPTSTNVPSKTSPADGHMIPNYTEETTGTDIQPKTTQTDSHTITYCIEEPYSTDIQPKTTQTDSHMIIYCTDSTEEPNSTEIPPKTTQTGGHIVPNCKQDPSCTDIPEKST